MSRSPSAGSSSGSRSSTLGSFIGAVATISVEPPMISTVSEARNVIPFLSRLTIFSGRLITFPSRLITFRSRLITFQSRPVAFPSGLITLPSRSCPKDGRDRNFPTRAQETPVKQPKRTLCLSKPGWIPQPGSPSRDTSQSGSPVGIAPL